MDLVLRRWTVRLATPVLSKIDFIAVARKLTGLYFLVFAIFLIRGPRPYEILLNEYGQSSALWFLIELILLGGALLLWGRFVIFAALLLFAFLTFVETLSWPMSDQLDWTYLGWVLIALVFVELKVEKKKLLELGWFVAGVTFTLHGLVKILNTGHDWFHGVVIQNILHFLWPDFEAVLSSAGILQTVCVVTGILVLIFHLLALPAACYRPLRKYYVGLALAFHFSVTLSPLYMVSLGMLPFWIFLLASVWPVQEERVPS